MQNVQKTMWSWGLHGPTKQLGGFSMPQQRESESAPNHGGGGMLTSKKEERRSEGTKDANRILKRPPCRGGFGNLQAKCGGTTYKTSEESLYGA